MMNKGRLIVISGPSGVGKGTIVKRLLADCEKLCLSVSATTREPRAEDTEGVTYFFKTKEEFRSMIDKGEFLEWAMYNGNYYGTPIDAVQKRLNDGFDVLLEIEVCGAMDVMKKCPDALAIFIAPPSIEDLQKRLTERGSETPEEIASRVSAATAEIDMRDKYNYIVVNNVLDDAVSAIKDIIEGIDKI